MRPRTAQCINWHQVHRGQASARTFGVHEHFLDNLDGLVGLLAGRQPTVVENSLHALDTQVVDLCVDSPLGARIRVVEEPHIFRALLSAGEGDNTTAEALFRVQLTEVPAPVVGRDAQNGTDQVPGVGTRRRGAVGVGACGVEGGVDVQLVSRAASR